MTEAAKIELEDIEPDDHGQNERLGQIRYAGNGSISTNVVKRVPVPETSNLAAEDTSVIVASDLDTGEDTIAIGFSDVHDGQAVITLDPRAPIARTNPGFLHDVVDLGMKELGVEQVTVNPQIASVPPQVLEQAGLVLDYAPAEQQVAA